MDHSLTRDQLPVQIGDLTPRERQILPLLVAGKSNCEIGAALGTSDQTVRHQLTSIMRRLDLTNRVQVAIWACRNGVLEEGS
jgi:DNA-binding NarL/FixJ family response regulator